jgi:3-phenylpropionate/cinnamic acid dioxygenase small subunit
VKTSSLILDETKQTLAARVGRLDTGVACGGSAVARTRHLVTNIEVEAGDADPELKVCRNFIVYRSRAETDQDL